MVNSNSFVTLKFSPSLYLAQRISLFFLSWTQTLKITTYPHFLVQNPSHALLHHHQNDNITTPQTPIVFTGSTKMTWSYKPIMRILWASNHWVSKGGQRSWRQSNPPHGPIKTRIPFPRQLNPFSINDPSSLLIFFCIQSLSSWFNNLMGLMEAYGGGGGFIYVIQVRMVNSMM